MRIRPEHSGASIVLIGSFNPAIFRPGWFVRQEIIGQQEADDADNIVNFENLAQFTLSWATLHVEKARFSIQTNDPPFIRIHDFVVNTFRVLQHMPIFQMGINRLVHFDVGDSEIRNKIGKRLAPQEPWGEWGARIEGPPGKSQLRGGLKSITMQQLSRDDNYRGAINVRLEPSTMLPQSGIFMDVNDHYTLGSPEEVLGATEAVDLLQARWTESVAYSEMIIDQIMNLRDLV